MKAEHRSYSGKIFRPTPEIENDPGNGLFIVATPWGPKASAQRVIQIMKDYIMTFRNDSDVTSPFSRLSCLSDNANNLRTSAMLANDILYREENKNEYVTGVELFAASYFEKELAWLQLGHPNIFLSRSHRGLFPLGSHVDSSMDLSSDERLLSPLPNHLLGLDNTMNANIGSIVPQEEDQVFLISRSSLPDEVFLLDEAHRNIDEVSRVLSADDPELAFWVASLAIDEAA